MSICLVCQIPQLVEHTFQDNELKCFEQEQRTILGKIDKIDKIILAGAFGAVMTGVFANPNINEAGVGLLYGNPEQVLIQLKAVLVVSAYSAVATFIIYKVISIFFGSGRVSEEVESEGMDMAYHGEKGFDISE